MDEIEKIASKVLGKTSDGKTMMRYETPDEIDPNLLVGIPRHLNRTAYDIQDKNLPFSGRDTWNCYEFSCLLNNGFPVSGLLRCSYDASSENIVESKSLKLYLNSFNMAKMGDTIDDVINNVESLVETDLKNILAPRTRLVAFPDQEITDENKAWVDKYMPIEAKLFIDETTGYAEPFQGTYLQLEDHIDVENIDFSHYNESPDILDVVESNGRPQRFQSRSLRSNCRVTNQPDWGDIYIHTKGGKEVTPESLMQYIVSMRKENHFHEEICECVYKRLLDLLEPEELLVGCLYTRRGGIDICPVRANDPMLLNENPITDAAMLTRKTMRQ